MHLGDAEAQRPLDDQRHRATADRVGRELVTVAREAGDAEEQRSGLHGAVVVGQARDLDGAGGGRRPWISSSRRICSGPAASA